MPRLTATIGLALTLGLVLAHANQYGEWYLGLTPLASRDLFWWSLLGVTLLYVILVERRPLASIGWRAPSLSTALFGIGAAAVILAGTNAIADAVTAAFHLQQNAGAANAITRMPLWYRALLVTRAALAEEVIFRGYAIERVEELTGSRILAGLVSLATFTAAHLAYWGWTPLIGIAAAGSVMILLYQWRRDLWANITAHFAADAAQLLF